MKSKRRDTVQKKRKVGYQLEKVIDYCKMKEKVHALSSTPVTKELKKTSGIDVMFLYLYPY